VRAPFLDQRVAEFAASLPSNYKLRGRKTKYILKRAIADLVPPFVTRRGKKGFGVPVGAWFKSGAVAADAYGTANLDPGFVAGRIAAHKRGDSDERLFLWSVLTHASVAGRLTGLRHGD